MSAQLATEEYERRRLFCETMKSMARSEYIEIARILRKREIPVSENRSGLFFDLTKLPQDVFEELVHFHSFVIKNNQELQSRDAGTITHADA
jgi:hypothetical protein